MADPWYVSLFKNYAHHYDNESFTQGTLGECDFIEQELGYDKKLKLLDVGCGTGRHTIELTKRGYTVTGIDLSEAQLQRARQKAQEAHLDIPFLQADARNLNFDRCFDAAIMLCEGGFCLMETDRENEAILISIAKALKDEALLIFTTLNGLFPLTHSLDDFYGQVIDAGSACADTHFNPISMRDHNTTSFTDDANKEHSVTSSERYYIPSELTSMLEKLGFSTIEFFGATLGAFSREKPLTSDDFEMLAVAKKQLSDDSLIDLYTRSLQSGLQERAYRLIFSFFCNLQTQLQQQYPQAKVSSLYQGYLDMSYLALVPPRLEQLGLKLAIVYVHANKGFEFWLAARNRGLQDSWREKLRNKVYAPYFLVEKGPGIDAIVSIGLEGNLSFGNQHALITRLCDTLDLMLTDLEKLLN